jgi:ABC-2 type transport system permease protein
VSAVAETAPVVVRRPGLRREVAKLGAFVRRDFLIAWSYKGQFFSDWANMLVQALLFYLVGRLIDPSRLPSFGGQRASYLEFASIGIAVSGFVQLSLSRVAAALRQEQMIGTLEALLLTPTAPATIQIGSVVYDLLYIPLRTATFLGIIAGAFGLHFELGGLGPAAVILLAFIPFVWGLGVVAAAATLTFKRGGTGVGFAMTILTIGSGAYFPLSVLPHWASTIAGWNPIAISITGIREAIIGGGGWSVIGFDQLLLLPISLVSLVLSVVAFKLAIAREQRRGTLAMY